MWMAYLIVALVFGLAGFVFGFMYGVENKK